MMKWNSLEPDIPSKSQSACDSSLGSVDGVEEEDEDGWEANGTIGVIGTPCRPKLATLFQTLFKFAGPNDSSAPLPTFVTPGTF